MKREGKGGHGEISPLPINMDKSRLAQSLEEMIVQPSGLRDGETNCNRMETIFSRLLLLERQSNRWLLANQCVLQD